MGKRGIFIVLEGPDGCGKTTQFKRLTVWLKDRGLDVVETYEPGDTQPGRRIRGILLDKQTPCSTHLGEAFLFCADRVEHLTKVVLPAIEAGKVVVTDRFSPSTIAYQGCTSDEPRFRDQVIALDRIARGGVKPDLCLVLWIDARTALARKGIRRADGGESNEFDERDMKYHHRVSEGYCWLVEANPLNFPMVVLVDARPDEETVFAAVQAEIEKILPKVGR